MGSDGSDETRHEKYLRLLKSDEENIDESDYEAAKYLIDKGYTNSKAQLSSRSESYGKVIDLIWLGASSSGVDYIDELEAKIELEKGQGTIKGMEDKSKVFIVHGHDNEAKIEVARFIEKLNLEAIILHEQASGSRTIIEKIEAYSDVGFGVVIYTPCDLGAKKSEANSLQGRARQNVVFEHGFLIGKLGRKNVCPLVKGKLETPNDISGIVYTSMDSGNWKVDLAKELRNAGYSIDMNKVI